MALNLATSQEASTKELTGEFVSGGGSFAQTRLSLESVDRLRSNLTPQVLRQLRYDSEVESSVEFLVDAVFVDGIQAVSLIADKEHGDFEAAHQLAEFVNHAVSSAQRKIASVMCEIFRGGFYHGVKAAEIVLKVDEENNLVLDRLNPKPNSAISFVCDRFFNVLGLASWTTFYTAEQISQKKTEIISREKFLILQFELEDNDPRGIKKICAVIDDYTDKQSTRKQYEEWRRTSAIPKKVGITPPNAKSAPKLNAAGSQVIVNGIPQTISAEKGLMIALEGFANNSTVTAPFGTDIKQLEVNGNGEQFIKSLKASNVGIRKGILGDSLATGEADKDARAAKEVALEIVELRIKAMKNIVAEAIERDVFRLLVEVNFGADKVHLTPLCSLGDTDRRAWATDLTAANGAGYQFAPEHLSEIDVQFGLKPRRQKVEPNPQKANTNSQTQGDRN